MRRHLLCALLALCCWCGPAQAAGGEGQRLLKQWGLAYCLSTYAHAGRLSSLAAEAAESLYGRDAALFDVRAASLRAFLASRVRDRMPCKDGENCSAIGCLNAVEHLDMASLLDEPGTPAAFRETVRPEESADGQGGVVMRTNALNVKIADLKEELKYLRGLYAEALGAYALASVGDMVYRDADVSDLIARRRSAECGRGCQAAHYVHMVHH